MKSLVALSLLLACSAPSWAEAQAPRIVNGTLSFDATDLHLRFEVNQPVAAPRISSEPGAVRLRFAEATGDVSLDLDGDGGAVRFVRVRPGAGDATVVVMRFTDRRQLDPGQVHVEIDGVFIDVTVARSALPAARVEGEAPAAAVMPEVEAPAPVVEAAAPVVAAPHGALFAPPSLVIGANAAPPAEAAAVDATAPAGPLGVRSEGFASGRTSLLVLLALVSAAALGIVQWLRTRKTRGETRLPITVVATHRISQRQQLVVVRALGQDHLLSIDGNRTERLCSQPAPAMPQAERESAPNGDFSAHLAEFLGTQAPKDQPVARTSGYGPTMMAGAPMPMSTAQLVHPAASAPMSMAPAAMGPTHAAASDAVAGLLRLRARAFR